MTENRAILLTPAGVGAIAVIRIAGRRVPEFLREHFSTTAREFYCTYGEIRDDDRVLDDAVVVLLPGNVADLNVHGGAWVVESMLQLLRRGGFVIDSGEAPSIPDYALDGETALEREVLAHLPLARTKEALEILLAQNKAWREFENHPHDLEAILADWSLYWLLHPPTIAIAGAANVGKSTLANQLFAQERSITADVPGTTRDWVGEPANIDGLVVTLIDTPGLRKTRDPIERTAIERSASQLKRADLVLIVLDASSDLGDQLPLVHRFADPLIILNKVDRARSNRGGILALETVATTGEGIDAVRSAIRKRFGCESLDAHRPRWWTDRQRKVLEQALSRSSSG